LNIRSKLILFPVLIIFFTGWGSILFAEGSIFKTWEPELRLIPACQISGVEDFDLKPQFSGRVEFLSGFILTRYKDIDYTFSLTGGYHYTASSTIDGGYSYNGFNAGYGGILIGVRGPLSFAVM